METKLSAGSKAAADVASLLRARNPLIWITTKEEARAERLLLEAAQAAKYVPLFWDCATGVSDYAGEPKEGGNRCTDPAQVISNIRDSDLEAAPAVSAAPSPSLSLEF